MTSSTTSPSSTLVNVAEDAEVRLINLLVDSAPTGKASMSPFHEQCTKCITAGDAAGLLRTIINSNPSAIQSLLVLDNNDEACAAFSLLTALLQRVKKDQPTSENELASALRNAVVNATTTTTTPVATAERKVALLSVLYNMRSNPMEKCQLLEAMIRLSATSSSNGNSNSRLLHPDSVLGKLISVGGTEFTTMLVGSSAPSASSSATTTTSHASSLQLPSIVHLLDSWDVSLTDRRSLYKTVVDCMTEPHQMIQKQQFLLLLSSTYNDTSSSIDQQGIQAARESAIGAIRDPVSLFYQQRDLLNQPAIQSLMKTDSKLYGLLQVFQEGKLTDYEEYINKNGGSANEVQFLQTWGFDASNCQKYMKILSLCSLAAEHEEIPYSEIATTLKLQSNELQQVETWVIAAVNTGLVHAKMDQLAQKVLVENTVVRKFDIEQWKGLQKRLQLWKNNIGSILSALQQHTLATTTTTTTTTASPTATATN